MGDPILENSLYKKKVKNTSGKKNKDEKKMQICCLKK